MFTLKFKYISSGEGEGEDEDESECKGGGEREGLWLCECSSRNWCQIYLHFPPLKNPGYGNFNLIDVLPGEPIMVAPLGII